MAVQQSFYPVAKVESCLFSEEVSQLVETNLVVRLCDELKEYFRQQHKEYYRLLRFNNEMENIMLENRLMHLVIDDILATDQYTIDGIALYTRLPEDVIYELYSERNPNPSLQVVKQLLKLHRTVRPDLYSHLLRKVMRTLSF